VSREAKYTHKRGFLSGLKARLQANRLGELLILGGDLSAEQLDYALQISKDRQQHLGRVLVQEALVSRSVIRRTLAEQFTLRCMTFGATLFISFAGMAASKSVRAGQIKDIPMKMAFTHAAYSPMVQHPNLFGSTEKKSRSLKAFTKWIGMFDRFEQSMSSTSGQAVIQDFKNNLSAYQGLPLNKMAVKVNDLLNKQRYIGDDKNYGATDYWATPVEFLTKGGDCEDYAIAKYTALRALGVPEERLRIAIVQDLQKNIPHAILVVYTDQGPLLLDNQIKTAVNASRVSHYKPIFSINRDAWWLHTKPDTNVTVVASAAR